MAFRKPDIRSLIVLIVGFIPTAVVYWIPGYGELSTGSREFILSICGIALLTGAVGAFLMSHNIGRVASMATLGCLMAVLGRVAYDVVLIDASHHNLWPLEVVMVVVICYPISFAGTFLFGKMM